MELDLLHTPPQRLADTPIAAFTRAVRDATPWTPRHGEVAEYVCRHALLRLLVRRHTVEELSEFHDALARLVDPRRADEIDAATPGLRARIDGYVRLVDARLGALAAQAPEDLLARAHVMDVLRLVGVQPDGVLQSEIGRSLDLGKPNLTRVLNLMENNELVARSREGRDNRVRLGSQAPAQRAGRDERVGRFVPRTVFAGATT